MAIKRILLSDTGAKGKGQALSCALLLRLFTGKPSAFTDVASRCKIVEPKT